MINIIFNNLVEKDFYMRTAFNFRSLTEPISEILCDYNNLDVHYSSLSEAVYITDYSKDFDFMEYRIACHVTPAKFETLFSGKEFNDYDNFNPRLVGFKHIFETITGRKWSGFGYDDKKLIQSTQFLSV